MHKAQVKEEHRPGRGLWVKAPSPDDLSLVPETRMTERNN